jgi:hypothetical protein
VECCQEQIAGVYGNLSLESLQYQRETGAIG